jgi:hypothetical protein
MGLSTQVFIQIRVARQNPALPPAPPGPPKTLISFNDFKYLSQQKTTADYFQGQVQCYFFINFVLLFTKTNWENFGNFIF